MRLCEKLPNHVIVNGEKVKLNLDFRNVLRMIDVLGDDNLMSEARDYLALKCVYRHPKKRMLKDIKGTLNEIKNFLFGEPDGEWHERITDYSQDAEMILSAFRQVYGINLLKDRLHWFEFTALLINLPQGNKYTEVLSIRARPIPVATQYNTEERQWLMKAKLMYGLKFSEKEQQEMFRHSMKGLASGFSSMAGGGK